MEKVEFKELTIDGNENVCTPLFFRRDGSVTPDTAYLEFRPDGTAIASTTQDDGVPSPVFEKIYLRYKINPWMFEQDIRDLYEKIKPRVEELMSNSDYDHDGRKLTEEQYQEYCQLDHICNCYDEKHFDSHCGECEYCTCEG